MVSVAHPSGQALLLRWLTGDAACSAVSGTYAATVTFLVALNRLS
jgi:hypothetical protein